MGRKPSNTWPNPEENGSNALMAACGKGHEACVRLLISAGAKIDAKDREGDTSLMYACGQGCASCCRLLINEGADVLAKNKYGDNPMYYATRSISTISDEDTLGKAACARMLQEAPASSSS